MFIIRQIPISLHVKSVTQETTFKFICNTRGQLLSYSIFKTKNIALPLNEHKLPNTDFRFYLTTFCFKENSFVSHEKFADVTLKKQFNSTSNATN